MLSYVDQRCVTSGCRGDRFAMRRCVSCYHAKLTAMRQKRGEELSARGRKPRDPRGPTTLTKVHRVVLAASDGLTAVDAATAAGVLPSAAKRALRSLLAMGDVRRVRNSARAYVYHRTGAA